MTISKAVGATVFALVGVVLVTAAPAVGANPSPQGTPGASAADGDEGRIIIRREGPLDRVEPPAELFVPEVAPSSSGTQADGFDWGDAAIGAGGAFVVMLLASGAVGLTRRRGAAQPTVPA
jgi:hypothetical protein